MSKRSPRLQFSDEEKAAPELKKAIQKAEKQSDKLDKAEAKIPKKTVQKKQFVVDADGKVTKHLHFEEVDKRITYCLKAVGMYNFRKKYVNSLSGGQQQRVSIARALVKKSSIII